MADVIAAFIDASSGFRGRRIASRERCVFYEDAGVCGVQHQQQHQHRTLAMKDVAASHSLVVERRMESSMEKETMSTSIPENDNADTKKVDVDHRDIDIDHRDIDVDHRNIDVDHRDIDEALSTSTAESELIGGTRSSENRSDSSSNRLLSPEYSMKVEYGLKLGYREELILSVLHRLGPHVSHDELLRELIENDEFQYPRETICAFATAFSSGSETGNEEAGVVDGSASQQLRPIIIDGSNVAMSHGNKDVFSCRGIGIAVDWFRQRGHKEITVFVPQWRKANAKQTTLITEQEILTALEEEKILVFTPSRRVKNKRISCYDDRYILNLAVENGGVVVSNDNYRDLISEKPEFKKVIEERLLMYSFVNDRFMPPDDPLGRHGPNIDSFLRRKPLLYSGSSQPCPYAKKCTYGNKCKFFHPERVQRPLVSVSQQIAEESQAKIEDFKQRGIRTLSNEKPIALREKPATERSQSLGLSSSPLKSPSELLDLSSIAIAVLSGRRKTDEPCGKGERERHSFPLPWTPDWRIQHRILRTVQSDPPRPSSLTKCSGHLSVAKKLSDEAYLRNLSHDQKVLAGWGQDDSRHKMANSKDVPENRRLLCRKASVDAAVSLEPKERDWIDGTMSNVQRPYRLNGSSFDMLNKDCGAEIYGHRKRFPVADDTVRRMNSAPLVSQNELIKENVVPVSVSPHLHGKPRLHRVCNAPQVRECGLSSSVFRDTQDLASTRHQNPACVYQFLPPDGGWLNNTRFSVLPNVASANCRYPGRGWIRQPSVRSSPTMSSDRMIPPLNPQGSTFYFGRNSSFQFVPAPVVPSSASLAEQPHRDAASTFLTSNPGDARSSLFEKLCVLFDVSDVCCVMAEHPDEVDSKVLCHHLLDLDQQRKQQHISQWHV